MRNWTYLLGLILTGVVAASAQTKTDLLSDLEKGLLEDRFNAFIELTDVYEYTRNDSALWASINAIKIAEEIGDHGLLAVAHKVAGIYYGDVGLYDKSIESFYAAIGHYDSAKTETKQQDIAGCYHNLAWNYAYLEQVDKVAPLFHKSLSKKPLIDAADSINQTVSFHALGSFYYLYDKQYDSAVFYLNKTVKWRKQCGATIEEIAQAQVELGQAYYESGQLDLGDLVVAEVASYPGDSVSAYIGLYLDFLKGVKLHQQGRYKEAFETFIPIYEFGEASNSHLSSTWINLLRQMLETAKSGGLYEEGFYYLNKLRDAERQTIYKDRQRTTRALEISYETKRKENQIALQSAQLTLQTKIIWGAVLACLVVFGLCFFLYQSFRKIQQKNRKINTLMRELHHRVKNNLQVISSLLGLQSMKLEDAAALKAVEEGKERIRAMSLIHQKLYQQEEVTALNIQEYISSLIAELTQSYGFESKAKVNIDVPSMLFDVDTTLPIGLIINELVSNAFKYAYKDIAEPILELRLLDEGNRRFRLSIKDNGMGLPPEFDLGEAKSFGLKLVNLLTKQLNGTINIEQSNGLEFQLQFELSN
ncbi:MAG: sensor histidine kinase [Cyclobacteriaceae bacterium]